MITDSCLLRHDELIFDKLLGYLNGSDVLSIFIEHFFNRECSKFFWSCFKL